MRSRSEIENEISHLIAIRLRYDYKIKELMKEISGLEATRYKIRDKIVRLYVKLRNKGEDDGLA